MIALSAYWTTGTQTLTSCAKQSEARVCSWDKASPRDTQANSFAVRCFGKTRRSSKKELLGLKMATSPAGKLQLLFTLEAGDIEGATCTAAPVFPKQPVPIHAEAGGLQSVLTKRDYYQGLTLLSSALRSLQ